MSLTSSLAVDQSTRTGFLGSDVATMADLLNRLVRVVAYQCMPGVVLTAPSVTTGTSSAKTWRSEAFTFTFRGKEVSAAAKETALTATTHDVAASKEAWFALSVQSDGTTFTITKAADQTVGTRVLPSTPDNEVLVGLAKVVTGSGGPFDATTDDFDVGGNITALTFYDAEVLSLVGNESDVEIT